MPVYRVPTLLGRLHDLLPAKGQKVKVIHRHRYGPSVIHLLETLDYGLDTVFVKVYRKQCQKCGKLSRPRRADDAGTD